MCLCTANSTLFVTHWTVQPSDPDSGKSTSSARRQPALLGRGYRDAGAKGIAYRPGREVDYSPPGNAEIQNAWSQTSIPPSVPSWRVKGQLYFRWEQGWTLWHLGGLRVDDHGPDILPTGDHWRPLAVLG